MNDSDFEWWSSLRHNGMMIAPSRISEHFKFTVPPLNRYEQDRLRGRLIPDKTDSKSAAALLDTVLERVIGLKDGSQLAPGKWLAGASVEGKYSRRALTGEMIRPRRVWVGPNAERLPVFVDDSQNLGVGRGRRGVARVVEWMRGTETRVALLTNYRQWRIVAVGLDWDAWAESDSELWFENGAPGPQLTAIRMLLSPQALLSETADKPGALIAAILATRRGHAEISGELGERVRRAVELLIQANGDALAVLDSSVTHRHIYVAATRIVMRMVVALFAEARDLLPRSNPAYHNSYGLQGLLESLERAGSADRLRHRESAWPRILALFRLVYMGSHHPSMPIRSYAGGLFRPSQASAKFASQRSTEMALAVFESAAAGPNDLIVHDILKLLTRARVTVRQGHKKTRVWAPVDFSDLSTEYIGTLYEGLLDYELRQQDDADDMMLFLAVGDQPALPLSRLEKMTDREIAELYSKLKQAKKPAVGEDEDEESAEPEPEVDDADEDGEEDVDDVDSVSDPRASYVSDSFHALRARANAWGLRAVVAAGLAPKQRSKQLLLDYDAALQTAAKKLVHHTVMPGEWYLVRWGGTRKGAGTFYTRPQLAVPTVIRTLQPLAYDAPVNADGSSNEDAPASEWLPRLPEEILALKVCDPAMGSGSFLVSAVRYLADALVKSLYHHGRLDDDGEQTIARLTGADGPVSGLSAEYLSCRKDSDDFEARLLARMKRHVVERCIYGVDLDPQAVELGRLALWVETMDRDLPFEFLDHKIKNGNALVGCYLDQFQDYPAMALKRKAGDEKHEGVHFEAGVWTNAIADYASEKVKPALSQWISPQGGLFDEPGPLKPELVHQEAVEVMAEMHRLGTKASDIEEREQYYREFIEHTDGPMARLKQAMDAYCALWFWPAEHLAEMPLPADMGALSSAAGEIVHNLSQEFRFFHWEIEFPDVFARPGSGFDAIVGNPPWEIQKPSSMEFFSNIDPLYRTYGNQEARRVQKTLFDADAQTERRWLEYNTRFKALSHFVSYAGAPFGDYVDADGKETDSADRFAVVKTWRDKTNHVAHDRWRAKRKGRPHYSDPEHPYRHQGSADLNSYKLFLELGHSLLRAGGQMGLIVPSGIYTDRGTSDLRTLFLDRCRWRWIFSFENRKKIFPIHGSFKFCPIIVQKGGITRGIRTAFMRREVSDWESAEQFVTPYLREQVERFSPKTKSILEIRTTRDLEILERIYDSGILLGDDRPDGWQIKYTREFDMTNDSSLFPPIQKWEAKGFVPDIYNRWVRPACVHEDAPAEPGWIALRRGGFAREEDIEEVALPLYEGRMIGQFDFSQKGWESGKGRKAVWRDIGFEDKVVEPQFLMGLDAQLNTKDKEGNIKSSRGDKIGFMDVASSTNSRTMIATYLHAMPCGNKVPVLTPRHGHRGPELFGLAAVLNSFVYDYELRCRLGGLTINYFILAETCVPATDIANTESILDLAHAAANLNAASATLPEVWLRSRANYGPVNRIDRCLKRLWAITDHERIRLRCILDAVVAELYGLTWEDLGWILRDCDHPISDVCSDQFSRELDPKGFWRTDKERHPELRHTVLTLAAFADLKRLIADHNGDRDAAIAEFTSGGEEADGWMLPAALRLTDLGLGHDDRAQTQQPVREVMGPRFLAWQLSQSPEESWAECELHARNLLGEVRFRELMAELNGTVSPAVGSDMLPGRPDREDDFQLIAPDWSPQGKLEFTE